MLKIPQFKKRWQQNEAMYQRGKETDSVIRIQLIIRYEEKALKQYPDELQSSIEKLDLVFHREIGYNFEKIMDSIDADNSSRITMMIRTAFEVTEDYIEFFVKFVNDTEKGLNYFKKVIDFIIRLFKKKRIKLLLNNEPEPIDSALKNLPKFLKNVFTFLPEALEETKRLWIAFEGFRIQRSTLHSYLQIGKGICEESNFKYHSAKLEYLKGYRFIKKTMFQFSNNLTRDASDFEILYSLRGTIHAFIDVNRYSYKLCIKQKNNQEAIEIIENKLTLKLKRVFEKHPDEFGRLRWIQCLFEDQYLLAKLHFQSENYSDCLVTMCIIVR